MFKLNKNKIRVIIVTMIMLIALSSTVSAESWVLDSSIVSGASDIGAASSPVVFLDGSTWKLISGEADGIFNGWYWSGSAWVSDSSVVSGLADVGTDSKLTIFNDAGTLKLITGANGGGYSGYYWSGSAWVSDSSIVSGLTLNGYDNSPHVFLDGETWKMIQGERTAVWHGYHWSGSTWVSDSSVISGLSSYTYGHATVYNNGTATKLIYGQEGGVFFEYRWTGSSWSMTKNFDVIGISDVGTLSTPTTFIDDGKIKLITGMAGGSFYGYYSILPNTPPTIPTSFTNLGNNLIDHTPAITWTKGTDVDGDTVNTYIYVGTTSTPTTIDSVTTGTGVNLGVNTTLTDGNTYYYRLRSYDGTDWSDYTVADAFTMNTAPTLATSFTNLGNNLIDHTPTITWTKGTDADGDAITTYVYVGTTSTPTTLESSTSGETLNLGSTVSLTDGQTYYYRLRTYDGYEYSAYTTADSFRMNSIPTLATSFTNLNNNVVDHTPAITWTKGTDSEGDTVTTYVYVGVTSTPTTLDSSTTGTGVSLGVNTTLTDGSSYYYRLRSYDGYEWSSYTTADAFRMNIPPTIPTSFTDLGNNLVDKTPTITWTKGTDADGDTITTYVYVGTTSTPTTLEGSTTGVTLDLGNNIILTDSNTYNYRLRSYDGYEWSSYTTADEFSIILLPVQNLTSTPDLDHIHFNWDDYIYAQYTNIYELEESAPYINTSIILDGIKDQVYTDYAHSFIIRTPNPQTQGDYGEVSWVRTDNYLFGFSDDSDFDIKTQDDYFKIGIDITGNGLTSDDRIYQLNEGGQVTAYDWNVALSKWQSTATAATGVVIGAGSGSNLDYEIQIPLSELVGFVNGATAKFFMEREDTSLNPTVESFFPETLINETDNSLWASAELTIGDQYNLIGNSTSSSYDSIGLTDYTWYKHKSVNFNDSFESTPVYSTDITLDYPKYTVTGTILDENGNPISNATVYAQDGIVFDIDITDINGTYSGEHFHNDTYTLTATVAGYDTNSTQITIAGANLTNVNIILSSSNFDNFTFYNSILLPTVVRENSPFTVSLGINDSDGTIVNAIVKISGTNYTMINSAGENWYYTFTKTILPTEYYIQNFYAQDNSGAWNSTTSNLTIFALSSTGTGSSGGTIPTSVDDVPFVPNIVDDDELVEESNVSSEFNDVVTDIKDITGVISRQISENSITIVKFNFDPSPKVFYKEIYVEDAVTCKVSYNETIIKTCTVNNGIVTLSGSFIPSENDFISTSRDYVTIYTNDESYFVNVDVILFDFMSSFELSIWSLIILSIFGGIVYYYKRK